MCLILVAWRMHGAQPLVVAANRDEFHARPASPAGYWSDCPGILAGRDLEAMGTWMGVSRSGRFAAVTNFRGAKEPAAAQSRGALVAGFLASGATAAAYVGAIDAAAYSGFNLLAFDGEELWWTSNRGGEPRRLSPGIYGLGNTLLDAPEVDEAKRRFSQAIVPAAAVEPLFGVLAAARVVGPQYGTRCSTVLLRAWDGTVRYAERGFSADGGERPTVQYQFTVS
jgi:uncharacterized protein with NRDE domain